jgi:nucleotide sugar dehydrogenase
LRNDDRSDAGCNREEGFPGIFPGANQRNSDFLRLSELYSEFNPMPKIHTALREAELVKILENCYRDVQIAFANEVASICHDMGMESREVIRAANTHPRVQILSPGLGVGGDCIPTDSQFLQGRACPLIQQARKTNSMQESRVAEQIFFLLNGIEKKKILILGAAYKGGVSDTTNSPSLKLAAILREFDAEVTIHDPFVPTYNEEPRGCFDLVVVGANHLVFADLTWLDKQAHQILDCVGIVRDGGKMEVHRL